MRKTFLILLICSMISIGINSIVYAETTTIDNREITYSIRETSSGLQIELSEEDYKHILITAITSIEEAELWQQKYNNLLDNSVNDETYNETLDVLHKKDDIIMEKNNTIDVLTYSTIGLSVGLATSIGILILQN